MFLTNTVNFAIGSIFCKGSGSAFSKGPFLLKVHFIKYAITLWLILVWLTLEVYLEPSRTSAMELLFKNSWQLLTLNYFLKKAPSQMFDWALNTPLNTYYNNFFFSDVSTLKLMTFLMLFQRLIFPTNTCQKLKRI